MPVAPSVHYELLLPSPQSEEPHYPRRLHPFTLGSGHTTWLEIHRDETGLARFIIGAPSQNELELAFEAVREVFPGATLGRRRSCPIWALRRPPPVFVRAVPLQPTHYWPLRIGAEVDRASQLLRSITAARLGRGQLVLQVLFRGATAWEHGFLSGSYSGFLRRLPDTHLVKLVESRAAEAPFHVEIRAAVSGTSPGGLCSALAPWVHSWTSLNGGTWWSLQSVRRRKARALRECFLAHDVDRFPTKKVRRDISATELSAVLPIPLKERHPNIAYAGAPEGRPPRELLVGADSPEKLRIGYVGRQPVCLPTSFNHLAILGRTRSGKSTLALSIALEILRKQPEAHVVVLEPTGELIDEIAARLPSEVAEDTIEVNPSRPTFEEEGVKKVAVPLNLLQLPPARAGESDSTGRREEKVAGGLVLAIKDAWGDESIRGRGEYVVRGVILGLLKIDGTTLVDAYAALSDKETLRRLMRISAGTPAETALRTHFPKFDYSILISSLDKFGKVAENTLLRTTLCQRYDTVSFTDLLRHRLLLLNLGKGPLGTDGSTFLGALLLSNLWSAIQERRKGDQPIYLIVDEFHNYAVQSFADMLSEGARLGLHVVAVTQYLKRIPPKVRSALTGNVDAWAMFQLGAEDFRDAWDIVHGKEFGWKPEDLQGGLGPHEAAYFASRSLLKLATSGPATVSSEVAHASRIAVGRSSRRYARREDSRASPLNVSQTELLRLLESVATDFGVDQGELTTAIGWRPDILRATIALGIATGDLVRDSDGRLRLSAAGRYYRDALGAARTEGEDHSRLLAGTAAFLETKGTSPRILAQAGCQPTADAEFERGGVGYNVEAESTTLTKEVGQFVFNVRKALASGRRCLIAVADRDLAERAAGILASRIPEVELWREVGIVYKDDNRQFTPYAGAELAPWGWLVGERDTSEVPVDPVWQPSLARQVPLDTPLVRDQGTVRKLAASARSLGKSWATATDLLGNSEREGGFALSERRVGQVLASMRVPNRRVRIGGKQVRIYDISSLDPPQT